MSLGLEKEMENRLKWLRDEFQSEFQSYFHTHIYICAKRKENVKIAHKLLFRLYNF